MTNLYNSYESVELVGNNLTIVQNEGKLSDIFKTISNHPAPLKTFTEVRIAVDVLHVDKSSTKIDATGIVLLCRKIVVSGSSATIINPNSSGNFVVLLSSKSGGNLSLQIGSSAPTELKMNSGYLLHPYFNIVNPLDIKEQKPTADTIGAIITGNWNYQDFFTLQMLKAKGLFYGSKIQTTSNLEDVSGICCWVNYCAASMGKIKASGQDLIRLVHESTALWNLTKSVKSGARVVPILSSKSYESRLKSDVQMAEYYEQTLSQLKTQNLTEAQFKTICKAHQTDAQDQIQPFYAQLKEYTVEHQSAVQELNVALVTLHKSKKEAVAAHKKMVAAMTAKANKEAIMLAINVLLNIMDLAVMVGGMFLGDPEAGAAGGGEAASAESTVEELSETASTDGEQVEELGNEAALGNEADELQSVTDSNESQLGDEIPETDSSASTGTSSKPKPTSANAVNAGMGIGVVANQTNKLANGSSKDSIKSAIKSISQLKDLAKSAMSFWQTIKDYQSQISATKPGATPDYSDNLDTAKFWSANWRNYLGHDSINGENPITFWKNQLVNVQTQLSGNSLATDFLGAYKIMVNNYKNYYGIQSRVAAITAKAFLSYSHIQANQKVIDNWTQLDISALQLETKIKNLERYTNHLYTNLKFKICSDFEEYKAAYYYHWLSEATGADAEMDMDAAGFSNLLSTINNSLDYILSGQQSVIATVPFQDFNNLEITIPLEDLKLGSQNRTINFNLLTSNPHCHVGGSQAIYLKDAEFWLEGVTPKVAGAQISLEVNTSGSYTLVKSGEAMLFGGKGIAMDFIYKEPSQVISSWEPATIISQFYMKPSPFTQFTIFVDKPSDLDFSGFTGVKLKLKGFYHPNI